MNTEPENHWSNEFSFNDPETVREIEHDYPEMMVEFRRIMWNQYETFCKKQKNYGPSNISVGTSLSTHEEVRMSLMGIWFRVNDKMSRWKQMVMNNVSDRVGEPLTDTFQDMSVYAIIAQIVSNGKWSK